jgi:ATP-dependent helicase HrpB
MNSLPVDILLPALKEALLTHQCAVLIAAPGAGKTTRIPLALLTEPWLAGKRRILVVEPRRLATRSAAHYMAALLGEQIGETVGYRIKLDTRVGTNTRIEVITEGILTRLLQTDPALTEVGLVIFDEFHERNLQADLGLALCMQSQAIFREDLKVLVMSATLNAEPIAALLKDAPILVSAGRAFPVETHYLKRSIEGHIEPHVIQAIQAALVQDHGDMIVFLPGVKEIKRVESLLQGLRLDRHIRIHLLHGLLPQEAQDRAIAPCQTGERKIVLATSIAETSLTVEGVRIVIDCGLMRIPRFSPRSGMTHLQTIPVSKVSADQRRGRAGRLGPGVCYRLWNEQENHHLAPHGTPEILQADLAPLALELAAWGVAEPQELLWLDLPPKAAYQQARELLSQLGALDAEGHATPYGRRLAEIGMHPRLAHMIVQAIPLGLGGLACEIAALLNERDIFQRDLNASDVDLRLRVEAIRRFAKDGSNRAVDGAGYTLNPSICRQVLIELAHWNKLFDIKPAHTENTDACGMLLSLAYPDRIAKLRAHGRFLLRNGRGAYMADAQQLSSASYLVAAELADKGIESRILLAAALDYQDIERFYKAQIITETSIDWEHEAKAVKARKRMLLGAIVLQEGAVANPDPEIALRALIRGIQAEGLGILPWTRPARQLQERINFMFLTDKGWPDVSDETLLLHMNDWLSPHIYGMKSQEDLKRLHMFDIVQVMLSWEQRRELDAYAPTHLLVPSGSSIPIDYSDPGSPHVSVRLQEMFGLKDTPLIARGKAALTLHLLSPAQRPVQVTRDLASFWREAYFEVKKDLKGRYPKHYWPDDPLNAMPTNRTRAKM